jgi:signal peptidase I
VQPLPPTEADPTPVQAPPAGPSQLLGAVEAPESVPQAPEFHPATFRTSPPAPALRARWRWAARALQFGALAGITYLCLFNLSVVRGSSMAPRIHDGDRILIDHFSYLFGTISRGDIVVLKYPLDPTVDYIKRVIGLPGDEIELENGEVRVNGVLLDEPYVAQQDAQSRVHLRVKPAHLFVLGDNRPRSCDSREFGLVPQDYIRGKVEVRVWPPSRFGTIDPE